MPSLSATKTHNEGFTRVYAVAVSEGPMSVGCHNKRYRHNYNLHGKLTYHSSPLVWY